jgi:hypothetical protein
MVRVFFLLLILANLVIFVLAQGYLGEWGATGREPTRLKGQFQADRLSVTVRDEPAPSADKDAAPSAAGVLAGVCRRLGPLAALDAEALKKAVMDKGGTATALSFDETSYWVHIPPTAGGKEATDKKSQELKQFGVTDFFIVNDEGANRGAISLGLFHQEAAAKDMLQQLSKKGVRSAKVSTKVRKTDKVLLEVRGGSELDALLAAQTAKSADCPAE